MRIAVLDLTACEQPADLNQLVDHRFVGIALPALAGQNILAAKERQIGAEATIVHHVVGDDLLQHAQVTIKLELLHPVGRRTMNKARAFGVSHEIRRAEIADIVPFALRPFGPVERVHQAEALKIGHGHIRHTVPLPLFQPRTAHDFFGKVIGQQEPVPDACPALIRRGCDLIKAIGNVCAINDRFVGRDRPRRRGPDHDMRTRQLVISRLCHLELHPDREAVLVVVLNLCLGQRGLLHRRPHHGFGALVQRAVHQELHEFLSDHALGTVVHC